MKSIKLFLIAGLLFISLTASYCQSHLIKLGIPSLSYGRANLNYEFVFNESMSLNLRVGAQFPRNFPVEFENFFPGEEITFINVESGKWTSHGIMPSFRIYKGKKNPAPQGFYVSPYLSYNNNKLNFSMEYDHSGNQNIPADLSVSANSFGAGIMIGNQWVIKDRVVLDFNYFGIGVSGKKYAMRFKAEDENFDYEEIEQEVEDEISAANIGGPINISNVKSFDDGIKIVANATGVQFKCSLSVGYKF